MKEMAEQLVSEIDVQLTFIDEKTVACDKYLEFLASGSSEYSLDLLLKLQINLTNEKIINYSFKVLKRDIDEFEKMLTKKI